MMHVRKKLAPKERILDFVGRKGWRLFFVWSKRAGKESCDHVNECRGIGLHSLSSGGLVQTVTVMLNQNQRHRHTCRLQAC
ncbi:hypothetical protein KDK_58480 [Dictyobacter kobayashii]|uniref:Uncharacterized protein n=1 Tax=Dictyobacter kobayashii TaxID=2014872 RepID=A0A402ASF4_9CHLR|nr:hypothetical protein KDK_58480 [Dictyobacter kobayashii]